MNNEQTIEVIILKSIAEAVFRTAAAVLLCSSTLRNYFVNYARPLIYSTVMPFFAVAAITCSLAYLEEDHADEVSWGLQQQLHDRRFTERPPPGLALLPQAIADLHGLAAYCNQALSTSLRMLDNVSLTPPLPFSVPPHGPPIPITTPIIPVITHDPKSLSVHLIKHGFLVRPIAYPTCVLASKSNPARTQVARSEIY